MRSDVRILFLAADPTDASRLRLGEEQREIQEKISLAKYRDRFHFESRMSVRSEDVSQALLDVKPRIVHFAGHGGERGELCFEDKVGSAHFVEPNDLAKLFEQFKDEVECVILSACFSEKQAKAIARSVKFVIGMNNAISDKAAIAFAIGFYQGLGAGKSIKKAFDLGAVQIGLQGLHEDSIPTLLENQSMVKTSEVSVKKGKNYRHFVSDDRINRLIANVDIGDWDAAIIPAMEIVKMTNDKGENRLFLELLEYQNYQGDDNSLWSAIQVIETCVQISPALIDREKIAYMAKNEDSTIRGMAASICLELAQFAPSQVPIDILLRLSRYDEDWYVEAPANAAIKSIAAAQPIVIEIYYRRLLGNKPGERSHAAYALKTISENEPELLNVDKLNDALNRLKSLGDKESCELLEETLQNLQGIKKQKGYKYGL